MTAIDYKNPISSRNVLNAGVVALMSVEGDDATPAQIARTSFSENFVDHPDESNNNLIDFLMRKHHDTPFEFPSAIWYMRMPIFVARQMIRHRTSSVNEESLRYIEPRPEFWIPSTEECKGVAKNVKQGSSNSLVADPTGVIDLVRIQGEQAHAYYHDLQQMGLANELARTVLPLGQYTAWYWKSNLRNLLHLLNLRTDSHAQYQIRVYADAMLEQIRAQFPVIIAAWENHVKNAVTFAADEMVLIRDMWSRLNVGEEGILLERTGLRDTRLRELRAKLE